MQESEDSSTNASSALVDKRSAGSLRVRLDEEIAAANRFARAQHAQSTRRAYRSDWRIFDLWCAERGVLALPADPSLVAIFLASEAETGKKPATITRRLAAIGHAHRLSELPSPTTHEVVRATLAGIRRVVGVAPRQKKPLLPLDVDRILNGMKGGSLRVMRDRAILLLGFVGAFRRSELAGLLLEDVEQVEQGLRLHLRRSKTNQDGNVEVVPIPLGTNFGRCPVTAIKDWLDAAQISSGPVFRRISRSGRVLDEGLSAFSIAQVVKDRAEASGLEPSELGGHSLRAGFVTAAVAGGKDVLRIMDITRHKRVDTLRAYIRRHDEFVDHPAASLL